MTEHSSDEIQDQTLYRKIDATDFFSFFWIR